MLPAVVYLYHCLDAAHCVFIRNSPSKVMSDDEVVDPLIPAPMVLLLPSFCSPLSRRLPWMFLSEHTGALRPCGLYDGPRYSSVDAYEQLADVGLSTNVDVLRRAIWFPCHPRPNILIFPWIAVTATPSW